LRGWIAQHDTGGKGSSSGSTSLVGAPSLSGSARKFVTKFGDGGDERFSVSFADDQTDTNFLYDAWVYFDKSSTAIGNLEMDVNQVMPNGQNAIFAFQCAGYDGVWEYTQNTELRKRASFTGRVRHSPAIHAPGQLVSGIMCRSR